MHPPRCTTSPQCAVSRCPSGPPDRAAYGADLKPADMDGRLLDEPGCVASRPPGACCPGSVGPGAGRTLPDPRDRRPAFAVDAVPGRADDPAPQAPADGQRDGAVHGAPV